MKCRSEWHSPHAAVRISTSWGPGLSTRMSSITSGWPGASRIAALVMVSPVFSDPPVQGEVAARSADGGVSTLAWTPLRPCGAPPLAGEDRNAPAHVSLSSHPHIARTEAVVARPRLRCVAGKLDPGDRARVD